MLLLHRDGVGRLHTLVHLDGLYVHRVRIKSVVPRDQKPAPRGVPFSIVFLLKLRIPDSLLNLPIILVFRSSEGEMLDGIYL